MASPEFLYQKHPFFVADTDFSRNRSRFFAEDRVFDYRYYSKPATQDTQTKRPAARSMPYWLNIVVILTSVAAAHLVTYFFFD